MRCVERGSGATARARVRASAPTALTCSAAWRTRPTGASRVSTQTNAKPCTWDGQTRHGDRMQLDCSSAAKLLADNKLNMSEQGTLAAVKVNNTLVYEP